MRGLVRALLASMIAGAGCSPGEQARPDGGASSAAAEHSATGSGSAKTAQQEDAGSPSDAGSARPACDAPSTRAVDGIDARGAADVLACHSARTKDETTTRGCGTGDGRTPIPLARLDEAVLPFDDATLAHAIAIASRGRGLGRKTRVFGLVGDSITASAFFLDPFGARSKYAYALSPEVEAALRTPVEGDAARTIVDYYRGVAAEGPAGLLRDSFSATRAAKVGARTEWALPAGGPSPVAAMIDAISPAVAIVMLGTNDAAYRIATPDAVAHELAEHLGRLVELLEDRGVVPILSTLPRHLGSPGRAPCGQGSLSTWRLVVQTNAASAAVAKLACERALPLVDYRHALDALPNRGIGHDGIHPTTFGKKGAGQLDADGLECGFNVRNYVTLRMLKQVKEAVLDRP